MILIHFYVIAVPDPSMDFSFKSFYDLNHPILRKHYNSIAKLNGFPSKSIGQLPYGPLFKSHD